MYPNRKQFIESRGATCNNWNYAWSFINPSEKLIIFGLWDIHKQGDYGLIFSENWEKDEIGHKKKAYKQSLEHIRLLNEEEFKLQTFDMVYDEVTNPKTKVKSAKYKSFSQTLTDKVLFNDGPDWKCGPIDSLTNSSQSQSSEKTVHMEGTSRTVTSTTHERNPEARKECLEHFGYKCNVCEFDFEKSYGSRGKKFIHVHHRIPLSKINKEYQVKPLEDLIPLCPNCHAMIHRGSTMLSVKDLKSMLKQ